ncbi:phage tail protein [Marispirochaeta sp.]|uniref:phage tail protein n=1 Tax=Marispirochaeta sp. TaxID=2038653 RepID=UPI0029C77437|nr:phage tail protein [Marispirochaeta sp.]
MKIKTVLCLSFFICSLYLFSQTGVTPSIEVTGDGVGIGIDEPQEMLEVNGRIRDKSGFVMPVGSILPFAGDADKVPAGWLLCDGRAMPAEDYVDLFQVIGTNYGNGSTDTRPESDAVAGEFNIPDLRGMFLRGVDDPDGTGGLEAAGVDPDFESRDASVTGGNSGGQIGSIQSDAFQGHWHDVNIRIYYDRGHSDYQNILAGNDGTSTCDAKEIIEDTVNGYGVPRVSKETRPRNIYVNYIIKY